MKKLFILGMLLSTILLTIPKDTIEEGKQKLQSRYSDSANTITEYYNGNEYSLMKGQYERAGDVLYKYTGCDFKGCFIEIFNKSDEEVKTINEDKIRGYELWQEK